MIQLNMDDLMVDHPKHYISESGLEVIDVIEAFTKDLSGIEATDTANIIKYACRWNKKNGVQDLKKIVWYANHLIEHQEKKYGDCMEDLREEDYDHPYRDISFPTIGEAEDFYDAMLDMINDNRGSVTVDDLLDVGFGIRLPRGRIVDQLFGWDNLPFYPPVVRKPDGTYTLVFPKAKLLDTRKGDNKQ